MRYGAGGPAPKPAPRGRTPPGTRYEAGRPEYDQAGRGRSPQGPRYEPARGPGPRYEPAHSSAPREEIPPGVSLSKLFSSSLTLVRIYFLRNLTHGHNKLECSWQAFQA